MLHQDPVEDAAAWSTQNREGLLAVVAEHGSLLVRGLGLRDVDGIGEVFARLSSRPIDEREAFAPRQTYAEGVLSSTPWPANQQMCMHHELSYRLEFPGMLLFACITPPSRGGTTGLADASAVLQELPSDVVARFEREGWLLARSYNGEIGASVAEAFGTEDRAEVEAYCRANAIEAAWQPDGSLRTLQRRSAVVRHPLTGSRCWFNQIAFLNEWTLDPEVREYLVDMYGVDALPFNTRFGNGDPIDEELVLLINGVYEANTVRDPWQAGDLLIVDNVRTAHSREPFEGPRDLAVGMADPVRLSDCSPTVEVTAV